MSYYYCTFVILDVHSCMWREREPQRCSPTLRYLPTTHLLLCFLHSISALSVLSLLRALPLSFCRYLSVLVFVFGARLVAARLVGAAVSVSCMHSNRFVVPRAAFTKCASASSNTSSPCVFCWCPMKKKPSAKQN